MRTDVHATRLLVIRLFTILGVIALASPQAHHLLFHSPHRPFGLALIVALTALLASLGSTEHPSEDSSDAPKSGPDNLGFQPYAGQLSTAIDQLREHNRKLQALNEELSRRLAELQRRYEEQLSISVTLQESFLPQLQTSIHGYEVAHKFIAANSYERIGGDFYDIFEVADGAIGLVIGDVSGKGVGATMHAAMAKYMLMAITRQEPDPARALIRLNDTVTPLIHDDMFITLFYGVLYTDSRRLVYANAGHEMPVLLKSNTGECVPLETTGHPIGIFANREFEGREMILGRGDALLLCTDGITEARRGKDFFGSEGLQASAQEARDCIAGEMMDCVLARVHDFTGTGLGDDAALMIVKTPAA